MISEDLAMIISVAGFQVIGQAYDGRSALDMIHNRHPEIILLDIALDHHMSGLEIAAHILEKYQLPFIFITSFSDQYTLDQAKNLLPQGYIVKPFKKKDILATLQIVAHRLQVERQHTNFLSLEELNRRHPGHITAKEYDILMDVVEGLSNDQIGEKHFISINTVKTHLKRCFIKMGISSRSQVASRIFRG
jgi:DNA-binding NarL/FixJ family response regulator